MKYKISLYDVHDETRCFLIYSSSICPQRGTSIYFPHKGLYTVVEVTHVVSDDSPDYREEELLYIDILVSKDED